MRILLDKSDENIRAANELIHQHECYAASVHCAYYSCFQLIAYLLKHRHGIGNTSQWRDLGSTKGSHEHSIGMLHKELMQKDQQQSPRTRNATHFKRYMDTLLNMRHQADYREVVIDKPNSQFVYNDAVKLRELLFTVYQLTTTTDGSRSN